MANNIETSQDIENEFTLRDDSHSLISKESLLQMYKDNFACDLTLIAGNQSFKVHKIILAASSDYVKKFITAESYNIEESDHKPVMLKDIQPDILSKIIQYCYTSAITVSKMEMFEIILAAETLEIKSLLNITYSALTNFISEENCVYNLKLAAEKSDMLKSVAVKYIRHHFSTLSKKEQLLELDVFHLKALFNCEELEIYSETDVFDFLVKWCNYNFLEREDQFPELFKLVRIKYLPSKTLLDHIEATNLVKENIECRSHILNVKSQLINNSTVAIDNRCPRSSCLNKTIYVLGGCQYHGDNALSINKVKKCLLSEAAWTESPSMKEARFNFGACSSGKWIYVCGGTNAIVSTHLKSSMERFNVEQQSWEHCAPLNCPKQGLAISENDGWVYAAGGNDGVGCFNTVQRYDPLLDVWQVIPPMSKARSNISLQSYHGALYAMAGFSYTNSHCTIKSPVQLIERYDPRLGYWSCVTSLPNSLLGENGNCVIADGKIFAAGTGKLAVNNTVIQFFDIRANKWMPTSLSLYNMKLFSLTKSKKKVYFIGGMRIKDSQMSRDVLSFDTSSFDNAKAVVHSSLPLPQYGHNSVVI